MKKVFNQDMIRGKKAYTIEQRSEGEWKCGSVDTSIEGPIKVMNGGSNVESMRMTAISKMRPRNGNST